MGKLQDIKDEVAREEDFTDWASLWGFYLGCEKYHLYDLASMEVARRYAAAVAEDVLKRASDRATLQEHLPQPYKDMCKVDKQSILSTEINLDL